MASIASPPRILDLYCGAGGAGMGYTAAGFNVFAVDIAPMPNNPHPFHCGDALTALMTLMRRGRWLQFDSGVMLGIEDFAAIHASPPCQAYTPLGALHPDKTYPDLIAATRDALEASGKPYVIENVMAAPLYKDRSITLCGGMFGLRTYRHRRFESNLPLNAPEHPKHTVPTATKRRRERWAEGWNVSITGDVGTYLGTEAMGIDWMNGNELSQAIPPSYTEWIGKQLMAHIAERCVA